MRAPRPNSFVPEQVSPSLIRQLGHFVIEIVLSIHHFASYLVLSIGSTDSELVFDE